eukprot:273494_1
MPFWFGSCFLEFLLDMSAVVYTRLSAEELGSYVPFALPSYSQDFASEFSFSSTPSLRFTIRPDLLLSWISLSLQLCGAASLSLLSSLEHSLDTRQKQFRSPLSLVQLH